MLQLRASLRCHQAQARAEPQVLLCGVNSALQYGGVHQQTDLTCCMRARPGTEEASLGGGFPSETGIGHSVLLDAA